MPLTVVRRKQTGALTISGTIRLKGGLTMRVQRRAASDDPTLAAEEASLLEAEILRYNWYGAKEGATPVEDRPIMNDLEVLEQMLAQLNALRADVATGRADFLNGINRLEKRINGVDDRVLRLHGQLDDSFRISVPRRMVEP